MNETERQLIGDIVAARIRETVNGQIAAVHRRQDELEKNVQLEHGQTREALRQTREAVHRIEGTLAEFHPQRWDEAAAVVETVTGGLKRIAASVLTKVAGAVLGLLLTADVVLRLIG